MKKRLINSGPLLALALSLVAGQSLSAVSLYWDGSSTSWNSASNWSTSSTAGTPDPAAAPGSGDVATFNIAGVTAAQTLTLDAAQSVSGLAFLSGATGGVTINAGTGGATSTLTIGSGGISVAAGAGQVTISSGVTLSSAQSWTVNSTNALTFSGPIVDASGANALTFNGTGTVRLTGTNTFTGGVTLTSGTLSINNGSALGAGSLTLNGGTLKTEGNSAISVANGVSYSTTSTINTSGGNLTINGALTGAASGSGILKTGAGSLTLVASPNLLAPFNIRNGRVILQDANSSASSGQITLASSSDTGATEYGFFLSTPGDVFGGNVAVSVNYEIARRIVGGLNTSGTVTFNQNVSGAGSLVYLYAETGGQVDLKYGFANNSTAGAVKLGGGTMRVVSSANKSSTGSMTIGNGAWVASCDDYGNAANGTVMANGATSNGNGGSLGYTAYTTTVNLGNADTLTSDNLALLGDGGTSATKRLIGHNLSINSQNSAGTTTLGSSTGHTLFTGTISLSNHGVQLQSGTGSANFAGPIMDVLGSNGVTKIGSGTVVLYGTNTYTGTTTISSGTLQIGNGTIDGSISASSGISNSGVLVYNLVGTVSYGNVISGTGSLVKLGAGNLTLAGANTYTGATSVSAGKLVVSGSLSGSTNVTVASAAALELNDGSSITSAGAVAVSGTLALKGASTLGQLNMSAASILSVTLSGTAAGQFGQASTTGGITLATSGSGVKLSLFTSYTPSYNANGGLGASDKFVLALGNGTPVTGTFSNVVSAFDTNYNMTLNKYTDANGNIWAVFYNVNGVTSTGANSGSDITMYAIPEPSFGSMLVGGFGMLLAFQRFRSRRSPL